MRNIFVFIFLFFLFHDVRGADSLAYPIGIVTGTGYINVRKSQYESHIVVTRVKSGTRFAFQRAGPWYVLLDGDFPGAVISQDFMRPIGENFPLVKTYNTSISVRKAPNTKSERLGTLDINKIISVSKEGDWLKIQSGTFAGSYFHSQFAKYIDQVNTKKVDTTPVLEPATNTIKAVETSPPIGTAIADAKPQEIESKVEPPNSNNDQKNSLESGADAQKWDSKQEARFDSEVEKLFKKKNKNTTASSNEVIMPVFYRDQKTVLLRSIPTQIVESKVKVNYQLFDILKKIVLDSWFQRPELSETLDRVYTKREWIGLEIFDNSGVSVAFNEQKLDLVIVVNPENRQTTANSLGKEKSFNDPTNAEPPANFSTYVNINATDIIDTRSTTYSDHRSPLRAHLENGTNIYGIILEANGNYTEHRNESQGVKGLHREDVRLLKDFPNSTTRVSLGDLIYPVRSFQVYKPMAGISATTTFALNNSKVTYPTGNYEIYLKSPSKIYVWLNDQFQQTLNLSAGRHNLQDFPFAAGMNEIRLEIVDDTGQTETLYFTKFSTTDLLRPGINQFSYSVGVPSYYDSAERNYETDKSLYSLFQRYGYSEDITLGLNFQQNSEQSLFGLEGNWSNALGYFKFDPAFSQSESGSGYASSLQYSYVNQSGQSKLQKSFSASYTLRSEKFSSLGSSLANSVNLNAGDLSLGYNQSISKTFSYLVGFNYRSIRPNEDNIGDSYALNAGFNTRFTNNTSVNISVRHSHTERGEDSMGFWIFFLWSEPKSHQTVTATQSASDNSSRVDWNYNPSAGADSAAYSGAIQKANNTEGYSGQVTYNGNRFRGNVQHDVLITEQNVTPSDSSSTSAATSTKKANHVTTLQFGTSLAYANGYFGIGRPILDSFAVFSPIKNLRGERIDVNPDKDDVYIAKSDWMGAAVLPEISSYNYSTVVLGGKHIKNSQGIPKDHFDLFPGYKNGYGFGIGTDATLYISAKLFLPDGSPLESATGIVSSLDDTKAEPIVVFTNRRGIMRSEGFRPGKYKLEIGDGEFKAVEFTLTERNDVFFDLGNIKLENAE